MAESLDYENNIKNIDIKLEQKKQETLREIIEETNLISSFLSSFLSLDVNDQILIFTTIF